jgi:GTP cyclohydrolase I
MDLHRRQIPEAQLRKFERFMAEILTAFGMDLNTPATGETPRRFIRALFDITDGYDGDPKLLKVFATGQRDRAAPRP